MIAFEVVLGILAVAFGLAVIVFGGYRVNRATDPPTAYSGCAAAIGGAALVASGVLMLTYLWYFGA